MSQAFVVTTEEGGNWQRWRPGRFRSVHTVVFEDGRVWDCYVGMRKHPKTTEEMSDIRSKLPKTYSKVIKAGGVMAAVSSQFDERQELLYQLCKAVREFTQEAGVEWTSESGAELAKCAKVTDLPRTGDYARQLVELEL